MESFCFFLVLLFSLLIADRILFPVAKRRTSFLWFCRIVLSWENRCQILIFINVKCDNFSVYNNNLNLKGKILAIGLGFFLKLFYMVKNVANGEVKFLRC